MLYKITKTDGTVLETTEEPTFVKKSDNGCFVECKQGDATHVVVNGDPYKLGDEANVAKQSFSDFMAERDAKMDYMSMMSGIDIDVVIEKEKKTDDKEG